MTSEDISEAIRAEGGSDAEQEVLLDGNSCVSNWPLDQAEALLADPTPWWGSWPGDPANEPNRGPEFAQLANCVYGYCRYPKPVHLLLHDPQVSLSPTQKLLDALFFEFCIERFNYGHIRGHEPQMRQALHEVVQRVHSKGPPRFLAVTRLRYWLMDGDTRLGALTPSTSTNGVLSCQFAADPAFAPISPLFEEASQHLEKPWSWWWDWDTSHQQVAALGLTLLREDGVRMGLHALRIHEAEAAFYLSKERLLWDQQAFKAARERNT